MTIKDELHNVFSGTYEVRFGTIIQTITSYLENCTRTSTVAKGTKHFKEEEKEKLELFISQNNLWLNTVDFSQYVSEGAEQKVYLTDSEHVLKLNDSIYYTSWIDYFHNLLLHNYFFADTAYELIGFTKNDNVLYAIVKQAFVSITDKTDLSLVKEFLIQNGFENTRNNDYYNIELGIILEDLHDENVLTKNETLYFIDTVFYITDAFWSK
ncbi:putative polyvalent protein kinase domain-containing protein [Flavobacterium haoranii]|uniref:Uncharacterized protein n=1 Tax=Flavobacterium haoranii TaxID=683124 RepID=A0A1M6BJB7_9FLAO|nr:hypothetical protein [Flavobacterium haoranii]SHI48814.1 hypothetical protein SAMN05444337_0126 [Flavobacterium haoranii]